MTKLHSVPHETETSAKDGKTNTQKKCVCVCVVCVVCARMCVCVVCVGGVYIRVCEYMCYSSYLNQFKQSIAEPVDATNIAKYHHVSAQKYF